MTDRMVEDSLIALLGFNHCKRSDRDRVTEPPQCAAQRACQTEGKRRLCGLVKRQRRRSLGRRLQSRCRSFGEMPVGRFGRGGCSCLEGVSRALVRLERRDERGRAHDAAKDRDAWRAEPGEARSLARGGGRLLLWLRQSLRMACASLPLRSCPL